MSLPNMAFGQNEPTVPEFPFRAGDRITGPFMNPGGYVKVKNVGEYSFIGIVHGATDWQVDGTELVLGFNLDWERYS